MPLPVRCSTCQEPAEAQRPVCLSECPWEKGRPWFTCRTCVKALETFAADMDGLMETLADRADHYSSCTFCWLRKGLLHPGPLAIACLENRKAKERASLAAEVA